MPNSNDSLFWLEQKCAGPCTNKHRWAPTVHECIATPTSTQLNSNSTHSNSFHQKTRLARNPIHSNSKPTPTQPTTLQLQLQFNSIPIQPNPIHATKKQSYVWLSSNPIHLHTSTYRVSGSRVSSSRFSSSRFPSLVQWQLLSLALCGLVVLRFEFRVLHAFQCSD